MRGSEKDSAAFAVLFVVVIGLFSMLVWQAVPRKSQDRIEPADPCPPDVCRESLPYSSGRTVH